MPLCSRHGKFARYACARRTSRDDLTARRPQLLHACRALSGKLEQTLLHKETVFKAMPHLNPGSRANYQLLVC